MVSQFFISLLLDAGAYICGLEDGEHDLPQRMPPLKNPIAPNSKFTLNTAGVAGFFGGEEAISAMATVHLYEHRRWLGWFNSPGSYTIAKGFGRMANSRFWDGLFPGSNDSSTETFELDGKQGPQYIAALPGTELQTRHLGHLMTEESKEVEPKDITRPLAGRRASSVLPTWISTTSVMMFPFNCYLSGEASSVRSSPSSPAS